MSGILGTNFSGLHWREAADRSEVIARARAARDRLGHRGRDFSGDWYDDRVYLGHAEQAGLDSAVVGRLPLASKDASVTVTLDGHLTNAQELRRILGKKHAFHGNGGCEVVVQAYLQWGLDEMLARLRGSFALAIYDRVNARLCLVRDALGTRPLYYLHEELASGELGSLMFASELKALEALADRSKLTVDYTAVYDYLTYRYVPAPKTLYRQVRKLGAGQCVSFDLRTGYSHAKTFWQLPEPDVTGYGSDAEFVERAQELLASAVTHRLPGLVAGSSAAAVAAMCQRSAAFAHWLGAHHPEMRPADLAFEPDQAESAGHAEGAKLLSAHERPRIDLRTLFDEPFADVGFAASLRRLAALSGTVGCALSDVGAEVVFGTAPRYRHAGGAAPGTLGWFKSKLAGAADVAFTGTVDVLHNYTKSLGGLVPSEKARQKAAWGLPDDYNDYWYFQQFYRADLPRTLRFQHLDLQTLVPEHQLTQLDRQAARYGIEARAPLLDQDLLTWLLCAPAAFRAPQFDVQGVLLSPSDVAQPMFARIKHSLKGAATFLPGAKNVAGDDAQDTLLLLRQRFPEFDAT